MIATKISTVARKTVCNQILRLNFTQPAGAILDVYSDKTLFDSIMKELKLANFDILNLKSEDLAPVDQFHIGGLKATQHLLSHVAIPAGSVVLDIGCGLGGTSRHIASSHPDVSVLGVDITPEYIDIAEKFTELTRIYNAKFSLGSALALPVNTASVDVACMLHVGMNIADKRALFREVYRILKEDGVFAVYDVMKLHAQVKDSDLVFPVPWANETSQSFIEHRDVYADAASKEGFTMILENNRKEFAKEFFSPMKARLEKQLKMPPLSLALVFGQNLAEMKLGNLIRMLDNDILAPMEMVFQKTI